MDGSVPLDGDILVPDLFLGDLNILDPLLRDILGDVLSEVLDGVVVGDGDFFGDGLDLAFLAVFHLFDLFGDTFDLGLVLVLHNLLLEGDVLDAALTLDDFLTSVDSGSDNLSLSHLFGVSGIDVVVSSGEVLGVSGGVSDGLSWLET